MHFNENKARYANGENPFHVASVNSNLRLTSKLFPDACNLVLYPPFFIADESSSLHIKF